MATTTVCDSCGATVPHYERLTLSVPITPDNPQGGTIDLCKTCQAAVYNDTNVKKAMGKKR